MEFRVRANNVKGMKAEQAFEYRYLLNEPITIKASVELVQANETVPHMGKLPMDHWRVTFKLADRAGAHLVANYYTGTGHRRNAGRWGGNQIWELNYPRMVEVLNSLCGDYLTARDMPRDDGAAMDHLASEFGMDASKPGDVLRLVRALRKGADDLEAFMRYTGEISLDHFAEYFSTEMYDGNR